MFVYSKMRWDLTGFDSFDELWDLEGEEARAAKTTLDSGAVKHLYKVAGEQYVISIGQVDLLETLDRYAFGYLPMREHLIFETVWSLEEGFSVDDIPGYLAARREKLKECPKFLYLIQLCFPKEKRVIAERWSDMVTTVSQADNCIGMYRVAGQQRIIMIADVENADQLTALTDLPLFESSITEKVWALRDYLLFAEDVLKHYKDVL